MSKTHRGRKWDRVRRPLDQSYYWAPEWQADEAEAVEEIRNGKARVFEGADEAIAWLRSSDHVDPDHSGWCRKCGCAYPCPGSVVPTPVEPVSLTRGGFMLGR